MSRRSGRTKTLLEIAAERQANLNPTANNPVKPENIVRVTIDRDGRVIPDRSSAPVVEESLDTEAETEPVSPWLDTLFLALSLSALHFTLEVLTVHQYAQELRFGPIWGHTLFIAFPTLVGVIHLFHGHLLPIRLSDYPEQVQLWVIALRQLLYLGIANAAGCYLIQLTNDRGYYAVMKKAPGIGTVWVWAVLEMGLVGALAGVVGPGVYAWWNGYSIL